MHAHARMWHLWTLFTAYEMLNNMNKIKSSVETQKDIYLHKYTKYLQHIYVCKRMPNMMHLKNSKL